MTIYQYTSKFFHIPYKYNCRIIYFIHEYSKGKEPASQTSPLPPTASVWFYNIVQVPVRFYAVAVHATFKIPHLQLYEYKSKKNNTIWVKSLGSHLIRSELKQCFINYIAK